MIYWDTKRSTNNKFFLEALVFFARRRRRFFFWKAISKGRNLCLGFYFKFHFISRFLRRFHEMQQLYGIIRFFFFIPRKKSLFASLSSLPRHSTQNNTNDDKDKILPLSPNSFHPSFSLSLSLELCVSSRKRERLYRERETRREHAPSLNNISAVVHH